MSEITNLNVNASEVLEANAVSEPVAAESATHEEVVVEKPEGMTVEQLVALAGELEAKLAALVAPPEKKSERKESDMLPKNQRPPKKMNGRYVLLEKSLRSWGCVPEQQANLAKILSENFEVGKEFSQVELDVVLRREQAKYPQLRRSIQDVMVLFLYYKGLGKRDGKHAGFIARDFLLEK